MVQIQGEEEKLVICKIVTCKNGGTYGGSRAVQKKAVIHCRMECVHRVRAVPMDGAQARVMQGGVPC